MQVKKAYVADLKALHAECGSNYLRLTRILGKAEAGDAAFPWRAIRATSVPCCSRWSSARPIPPWSRLPRLACWITSSIPRG